MGGEGGSQDLSVVNNTTTTNTTTDFGAIKAATGLSSSALDIVSAANRDSLDFAGDIFGKSLTSTSHAYGDALNAVQDNADNTVSVISRLATTFGTSLFDYTEQEQKQLGNVVSALNSTYTANNTSANQQVINATTQASQQVFDTIKYIGLAAAAVLGIYLLTRRA